MADRGRPRAFDRDQALERAMKVFWARGFEGTSISDLTAALGINKPSLYAAFGCKEALFEQAVALYDMIESKPIQAALDGAPTARAAVEAVLRHNAAAYADADKPRGCLVVLASLVGTPENEAVRRLLAENRQAGEEAMRRRIAQGIADGDVPEGADAQAIAAFYTTVIYGLSVQARDGAPASALNRIVDCAMAGWDELARDESTRRSP
ncbi:TetR/AcrR family transcriptional regulator [Rhodoligotrophos defluvii]|uniref:TetR/AcrR family transcriptional regulator n=1 Tax=Rhodoligotrophos defluvii TaxID=2561934 RepID=UPI0010C9563D|nr:TetR/AcrR family transcriptional regulator [Rhodoligotrophos defluvii]